MIRLLIWSVVVMGTTAAPAAVVPASAPADHAARGLASASARATVVIFSRSISGTSCGNGFVIGDGTLIVTARHVVFPQTFNGLHQGDAFVTVLSPYIGDACEADIVAQDRALDVIVLRGRAQWKGHPALQLADETAVLSAEHVTVAGMSNAIAAVTASQVRLLSEVPRIEQATLAVNSVTVRRGISQTIVTDDVPKGPGWAGAPMVLPESAMAVGCFTRTQGDGGAGVGASAGAIRRLITDAAALQAPRQQLAVLADAPTATTLYLKSVAASAARDVVTAYDSLQSMIKLRPTSAIAYRDLAGQARARGNLDEAQNLYAKSLALEPTLVSSRVLYGQFLHERTMPSHALEHLRYAAASGRGSTAAVIPLCNLLREQKQEAECLTVLEAAVKTSPYDSYLWTYLGQSRTTANDPAGAGAAFARAAELMPENEPLFVQSAEAYETAKDPAKAEAQYRALTRHHPDSSAAHYFLARFLSRDAKRAEEALTSAQRALALAPQPDGPPKDAILKLIETVRASASASKKDGFSL